MTTIQDPADTDSFWLVRGRNGHACKQGYALQFLPSCSIHSRVQIHCTFSLAILFSLSLYYSLLFLSLPPFFFFSLPSPLQLRSLDLLNWIVSNAFFFFSCFLFPRYWLCNEPLISSIQPSQNTYQARHGVYVGARFERPYAAFSLASIAFEQTKGSVLF